MAGRGHAFDGPGRDVQRGIEGEGAIPFVLEAMALRSARRHREHRIEAVQRLNGRLLIDGEDHGIGGRREIQADDIGRFGLEVGIVARDVLLKGGGG
jgi:hypothetical protein